MAGSRHIAALVLLAGLALAQPSQAQDRRDADRATARTLFFSAVKASQAGDHDEAADLFDRSNRLYPAPTAALGLARALQKGGRWVRATETYYAIVRRKPGADEPEAFARATEAAKTELRALKARMPSVVITVTGPKEPVVTIDGVLVPPAALGVPRPVDPGAHEVVVKAEGFASERRRFDAAEADVSKVALSPSATPRRAPAERSPAAPRHREAPAPPPSEAASSHADNLGLEVSGYVIGAVGLGGFVGAAVTGGLYMAARTTMEEACRPGPDGTSLCSQAGLDAIDEGRAMETLNTAMLIAGGVGLATGVSLLVAGYVGDAPVEAAFVPRLSPDTAGIDVVIRY